MGLFITDIEVTKNKLYSLLPFTKHFPHLIENYG